MGGYRRNKRVLAQFAGSTAVLLNVDDGRYYSLNEVAGRIWDLCDGVRDSTAIAERLSADYEATAEVMKADVDRLLKELEDAGLVEQAESWSGHGRQPGETGGAAAGD